MSIPKSTLPKMAPNLPDVAVMDNAIALEKEKKHYFDVCFFFINFNFYLKFVGNKSTTTQNKTASRILVRASKIQDNIKVCVELATQFSAIVQNPESTRPHTAIFY